MNKIGDLAKKRAQKDAAQIQTEIPTPVIHENIKRAPFNTLDLDYLIKKESFTARVQKVMDATFSRTQIPGQRVEVTEPNVGLEESSVIGGLLYPLSTSEEVMTSMGFPTYIWDVLAIKPKKAMELAASSTIAFASMHKWFRTLRNAQHEAVTKQLKRADMSIAKPQLWMPEAFSDGISVQTEMTAIHRTAARVALTVCGMSPLSVPSNEGYPPLHLAALADPFTNNQAVRLHDTIVLA
ncbi:MAG: hypothetical protein JWO47_549 [Candidatus Saccharibacteria bacterium]|nr:hypothetical protein [Candidatus Saccharibacteria bacterium]